MVVHVELNEVFRARHMTRSFAAELLSPQLVDDLFDAALRAPSAGNTAGTAWVLLEGAEHTQRYWDAVTTAQWRARSARWPGLRRAPVVGVSLASPDAYLARYAEADKAESGLAASAWPVPYWFTDAAFATMSVLLGAVDRGIGAAFMGNFRGEDELRSALSIPDGWRVFGAVLLGHPDGEGAPSGSLSRARPTRDERVHRGAWQSG
jgi:nitroreductase